MKLSKPKNTTKQSRFWEQPLGNHGSVRTHLGDFVEELTARLFNGVRFRTDCGADYCPDVRVKDTYLECKTVGNSRQTLIYEGRLEKDRRFSESHTLLYCIWTHDLETTLYPDLTVEGIQRLFLTHVQKIYLVPFPEICRIALETGVTKLNSKYGNQYNNPVYSSGYRIPLFRIEQGVHYQIDWQISDWLF